MTTLPRLLESADFSPFFKSTVGFDRMMKMLDQDLMKSTSASYPPYNIEKLGDDDYRISMAVAGFTMGDIDITVEGNSLFIKGAQTRNDDAHYIHRGIATRNFEQKFQLADFIEVQNASLEHGMLHIDLKREVPEEKKPRKININYGETLFNKAQKLTKKNS